MIELAAVERRRSEYRLQAEAAALAAQPPAVVRLKPPLPAKAGTLNAVA